MEILTGIAKTVGVLVLGILTAALMVVGFIGLVILNAAIPSLILAALGWFILPTFGVSLTTFGSLLIQCLGIYIALSVIGGALRGKPVIQNGDGGELSFKIPMKKKR